MSLRNLFIFSAIFLVVACVPKKEHEAVQSELDSVKFAMEEQETLLSEVNIQMDSIGVLLDSIEVTEEGILLNLEEGISYDDYISRLGRIQQYMDRTNKELERLENALVEAGNKNKVYQKIIANYKRMLAEKDDTIEELTARISNIEEENTALVKTVDLQNDEITSLEEAVQKQEQEIINVNQTLDSTKTENIKASADKYFSLAQSTEALAEKTSGLFNSKKKKAHYRQAYEYYKQAFELDGTRSDAYQKMQELEAKF